MTTLEKIEEAIAALAPAEIKALAEWFAEFQADLWDRQIERDAQAGNLDKVADAAIGQHRAGRTRPL